MKQVADKYVVLTYGGKSFIVARSVSGTSDQFIPICKCETIEYAELIMHALTEKEESDVAFGNPRRA